MIRARLPLVRQCSRCFSSSPVPFADQSTPGNKKDFEPRRSFNLPSTVPSWYAGHMYRAMRSLPALLARSPPPLIVEVRDARLPLSSINPAFEDLLVSMEKTASAGSMTAGQRSLDHAAEWRRRRLIVYTKRDLIDERLCEPLRKALEESGQGKDVMFIDSRNDRQIRRLLGWIKAAPPERAALLASSASAEAPAQGLVPRSSRPKNLSGAFKHTPTPDEGVRLIILGMPNVGKSSLLNALRRVGTGKGKAASTAPEPGHTRKLTGTVRITKQQPTFQLGGDEEEGKEGEDRVGKKASEEPPVYVYDTPGVMVPFLGHGAEGAEKGVKLAVAAGIKSSLFDAIGLADYLLYRLNLQFAWRRHRRQPEADTHHQGVLPVYLEHLPLPKEAAQSPTNDITKFLGHLAERAPGTLSKGGQRDLDAAAQFFLDRWRNGKLGRDTGELDLGCWEESLANEMEINTDGRKLGAEGREYVEAHIRAVVKAHFDQVEQARKEGVATSLRPARGADRASRRTMERASYDDLLSSSRSEEQDSKEGSLMSKHQAKKRDRARQVAVRNQRLREKGVLVRRQFAAKKASSSPASAPGVAHRRSNRPRRK